ncbi:MAG: hypothetical protein AAGG44_14080 [Planctomycetota bacterium]
MIRDRRLIMDNPLPANENPFASPTTQEYEAKVNRILVRPMTYSEEPADCDLFTLAEFAEIFEQKLCEACGPFGVTGLRDEAMIADRTTSVIKAQVQSLFGYRISGWNKFKQRFLPFLGYEYRAASFEVIGRIESAQHEPVPFHVRGEFNRGRLAFGTYSGLRRNILVGMDAQALRIVSLALRRAQKQSDTQAESQRATAFWFTLVLLPFLIGGTLGIISYLFLNVSETTRRIQSVMCALAATLWTLAFLPSSTYRDSRLGFAYRLTAAKNALTLRGFPILIAAIITAILIASVLLDD